MRKCNTWYAGNRGRVGQLQDTTETSTVAIRTFDVTHWTGNNLQLQCLPQLKKKKQSYLITSHVPPRTVSKTFFYILNPQQSQNFFLSTQSTNTWTPSMQTLIINSLELFFYITISQTVINIVHKQHITTSLQTMTNLQSSFGWQDCYEWTQVR